ncbi:NYN domain-containing protein [Roseovarius sp. C7]|uniref:NYN domain-containing protein n=1 Tax=Roseovarius sp. C7 TaxID=3398643 RepID=UPI0039F72F64
MMIHEVIALAVFVLLALAVLRVVWRLCGPTLETKPAAPLIVIDGSNVMFWDGGDPRGATVHAVVSALQREGFRPVVWFDANAGYKLFGRYMGPRDLAPYTGVPPRQVFVAPKGTPADPLVLASARKLGARVVSNDRFRDWNEEFPELRETGRLVRGGVRGGDVRLRL